MLNNLLEVKGLISFVDLPTFQIMATKYQTIIECNELLKIQSKWIVDVTGNIKENPVCVTLEKAEKIYMTLAASFGCTPSARNNLKTPTQKEEEKDPLSGFEL
jgi:P27 family predicted phage terminase small subunit